MIELPDNQNIEEVEAEVVGDSTPASSTTITDADTTAATANLAELSERYNATKVSASDTVSGLIGSFTLGGMDAVNELVSNAMQEIQTFVDNGQEKSVADKFTGRALAIVDPNNRWLGKWANNTKSIMDEEKQKEQTINQVIDTLTTQIMEKREEVLTFIDSALEIKTKMLTDIDTYQVLLTETEAIIDESSDVVSRTIQDAKLLANMLRVSIENLVISLKSQVNPLIGSANIACNQIAAILPTIETDLKYTAGFGAFEQKLSDLNGMVKATVDLASKASDIIRASSNKTICNTLSMIGETGLDENRMAKVYKEQQAFDSEVGKIMKVTQDKMALTYTGLKKHHATFEKEQEENTQGLLGVYSEVNDATKK